MESPRPQHLAARRLVSALALVLAACGTARFEPRPVVQPSGPLDAAAAADLAVHNHPDARRALARLEEAEALPDAAHSLLWPDVQVGVAATRTDRPSQAFGSVLDQGAPTSTTPARARTCGPRSVRASCSTTAGGGAR